jgi:hypothetical protein
MPTDEEVVQTAAEAAEGVILSHYRQSELTDFDVTVTFEEGVLDVDVYVNAPEGGDEADEGDETGDVEADSDAAPDEADDAEADSNPDEDDNAEADPDPEAVADEAARAAGDAVDELFAAEES